MTFAMELKNFLPYQLSVLSNKVSHGIAKFYREQHDITIPEWRILAILSYNDQMTAKQLAESSQMDKVKISRTAKILLGKKHIKEKTCQKDARSRLYQLTKQGQTLINQVKPKAEAFEKDLISSLSDSEIRAFHNCINILNQQVDKITQKK